MRRRVLVVGAGLTGATAAWALTERGVDVQVVDSEPTWGGQLRTSAANGILFEPYGAHIFHTRDEPVWHLVNRHVEMLPYRHRVQTEAFDTVLSWPPQIAELRQIQCWARVQGELDALPSSPRTANFEHWCIDIMGPTLYAAFVEPYTRKQWGVDPKTLSSSWAPKRLEIRTDGYTDLFRDPYQGWPKGGFAPLIDSMLARAEVVLGVDVNADTFDELRRGFDATILTAPLDVFFRDALGALPWRGVRLVSRYVPEVDHVLPCGVVNHPGLDKPYTRRIETKWMSAQDISGTVVSEEYPGAPARHYPIDDAAGNNRALARQYRAHLSNEFRDGVFVAGRLATYTYIDMDQAMRQALNVATDVCNEVGA